MTSAAEALAANTITALQSLLLVILNEARRQRIATAEALIRTASGARLLPA